MLNNYPILKLSITVCGLVSLMMMIIVPIILLRPTKSNTNPTTSIVSNSSQTTIELFTSILSTPKDPTTTTTPSLCLSPCVDDQICFNDTCLNTGNLAITAVWSRSGDCDLSIQTPDGLHIDKWSVFLDNPLDYPDHGQVDILSETIGPENIFWNATTQTPYGTYYICLEIYYFEGIVNETLPVIATVYVRKPSVPTEIFTRTFTRRTNGIYICNQNSSAYIASFNYP